ncbi:MAG: hypothetical protein O3B01_02705 [Planctomycetota bacterium]|nr:hypothetical protein [Planctomycetota bacterium]MDA1137469.1 hypothetical protein [Planctomycetota bacterium]
MSGSSNKSDLRVLIRTSKAVYSNAEPVLVDFRLMNAGSKPEAVYNELGREGWLVLFALIDRKTGREEWRSDMAKVATRRKSDSVYAVLLPESTVGHFYTLRPTTPFPPGDYYLQAGYTNSYETCLASLHFSDQDIASLGQKAYVRLWTGQAVSKLVPVTITGQKMMPGQKKETKKKKSSSNSKGR